MPPDYDDLALIDGVRSSWGLWGADDRLGCLNLLDAGTVRAALADVNRGDVHSLNWRIDLPDPPLFDRPRVRHEIVKSTTSTSLNDVVSDWNTQSSSQWDGFRHVSRHGSGNYNGLGDGHGVHVWAERGIVAGAVLLDVARWRASVGRPLRQGTPDPISGHDLLDTAAAQRVQIRTGDVLLIRTGWIAWYESLDAAGREHLKTTSNLVNPGLAPDEETARVLWNLHPSAVAADNPGFELWPIGGLLPPDERAAVLADPSRRHEISLHTRLLPMLGLPMGELWYLERLADACAADGEYRACVTSAPLNLPHAAASPANALAIR
ncbi:cyclase family protein [Actinoplanes sp. NPDC051411]|uniref:cyclase family protein n=1 Tax=Actinoplanes sp. NPDC051411 TaxID=3155522 RepID=UPI0034248BD9